MRKFLLLIALLISGAGIVSAQDEITIGNGTSSDYNAPFNNYYKHSWNETIYHKGDIGSAGTITSVSYHRASASSYTTQTIKIYMGETTRSSISSTTDWTPASQLTLVYSGSYITIGDTEWETFTLNTPFEYSGENNLVVVVAKTASSYTDFLKWYYTNSSNSSYVSMYRQNDDYTSYAQHPSTNSGTRLTYAANIKLGGEFSTSEQPLTIGDSKVIDYNGYSLKYTVTSVNPAECDVTCSTKPTTKTTITIPTEVSIKGNRVLVTEIANRAFSECSNLTGIVVPNSVIRIDNYAFNGCSSLSDISFLDGTKDLSLGYNDWEGNEALFYDCPLKTIYLGRTLSFYGYDEFSPFYGKNLTSLIIGNSITRFENYTFIGNIKCLYINDLVSWCKINFESASSNPMRVAEKIYINNSLVTNLSIPANVTKINNLAIIGSKFNSISVVASNPVYDSRNNCNAIIETATNSMIVAHNNTIIPNSVVNIENNAFYGLSITNIHIPNTVVSINAAFKECYSLTNITFEENPQLSSIENYAFIGCYNLTNIQIPSSVTTIGNYAFYGCKKLSSVTFEDNSKLVSIGEYAFSGYFDDFYDELISPQITNIEIPNSVKTIGEYAFAYCEKLTTIGFGKNSQLTSIGNHAFQECYSLNNFVCTAVNVPVPYTGTYNMLFYECPSNMKISVPKSSVSLYQAASPWNNYTIEALPPQIAIGDNTTIAYNGYSLKYTVTSVEPAECEVEGYDVYGMPVGTAVTIPSVVKIKANDVNVTAIKDYAFYCAYGMVSIEIPTSVTSIGEGITNRCDYLENINIIDGNSVYDDRNNCNAIIETATNRLIAGCKNTIIPDGITSIGSYAFKDLSDLKYIEIPSSVTTLEECAFCQTGLLNIVFKDNSQLVSIERAAFANNNLISIEIPNSVKSIGYAAFESHANLTNISVEEGNTVYDSRNNCNAIIETATNTLILGGKNTVIPHGITHIERAAFQSIDLNSFTLPSSITYIGEDALPYVNELICHAKDVPEIDGSLNLSNVCIIYVPESSIDDYQSTYPWSNYTIMPIQASAGELGYSSIINYDGYSLKYTITSTNPRECEVECHTEPTTATALNIPSSVNISGMDYEVTSVASGGFSGAMYFKGELRIPNTVRYIGKKAFSAICTTDLIEIPNSVTYIGEMAFGAISTASGKMITKIILSNSASYIGEDAFNGNSIGELVFSEGTKSIGDNIGIYASKIIIPNSVECIGTNSISSSDLIICHAEEVPETSATSLGTPKNIQVPESSVEAYKAAEPWKNYNITKIYPYVIGDYAIVDYNGYSLKYTITNVEPAECEVVCNSFPTVPTAITIPSSVNIKGGEFAVASTGEWAFCEGGLSNNTTITSIELPNTVKSLGHYSFRNCSGLQSVTFGENSQLTTIGSDSFSSCSGLTSINIPNGLTTIGWAAFSNCTGLTSINIPNGVTTIGQAAFSSCTGLTSINIPNGVTSIGERAFMDCTSLSSVIFEENSQLTIIRDAFKNCTSLTSIEMPYGVSGIYSTFHNCTSLESVVIPETVNEMRSCFNNCSSLKTIICYAEQIPNSDSGIFQGVNENLKIYVPVVSVQQYEEDEFWGVFEIIGMGELPEGTSLIKDYGGYSLEFTVTSIDSAECEVTCSSMPVSETTLTIPSNVKIGNTFFDVTAIGYEAFDGNGHQYFVGDLVLPNTVREIKAWAFSNCTGFTSLTLSENLEIIGSFAFYGCTGLTGSLVIPNKVTLIKHEAFRNSINLNGSLTMSDNIEVIEYYAFVGCSFTGTLVLPASLKEIGAEALPCNFDNYVVYSATPAQSDRTNTPDHFPDNSIVYVPSVSLSLYETEWGNKGYYSGNNYEFIGMPTYTSNGWVGSNGTTPIETPSSEEYVAVNADMTIAENEIFHANTLGLTENGSLTIKDGGQLVCNDVTGNITVEKEIEGYADQDSNSWYTIASPLKGKTSISSVTGLITSSSDYDLYRYDEPTYTWQNYKNSASNGFTKLEAGRGYLYANSDDVTLSYTGNINTDNVSYSLTKDGDVFDGFHLIANPFTHNINFAHLSAKNGASLANGYYVLSGDGAWGAILGNNAEDVIKVGQGALIKAENAGKLFICREPQSSRSQQSIANSQQLKLTVANGKYSDKAFIVFAKGAGLDKINHQNENIPMLYIPVDGVDYAIATIDKNFNEIPVSFETNVMGQYTISLQQENCEFTELYLLDKLTGERVNILTEDYTFMAESTDNPNRFVLMKANGQQPTANGHFAYISNGNLIVEIEGPVQIIDMMGRIIMTEENHDGSIDISSLKNAAYIIRCVNENEVKTQKIVVL